jgi:hypothetical protein
MNDPTPPLSGLSSVGGKSIIARFDGGMLLSNSGVLAQKAAACGRASGAVHRRSALPGPGRPQPSGHDRLSHEDDRCRLRGWQRRQPAAWRSDLQDGLVLQLQMASFLVVSDHCLGLMPSSPKRPGENEGTAVKLSPDEAHDQRSNFGDGGDKSDFARQAAMRT